MYLSAGLQAARNAWKPAISPRVAPPTPKLFSGELAGFGLFSSLMPASSHNYQWFSKT